MGVKETDPLAQLSLPPGFRFYPTDEELLVQYLCRKVAGHHFNLQIIGEIDLYKFDPWVLPSKAMFGEKEWYFFSPRDRKYPNGSRPNRVAGSGYWKATGTDKIITTEGRKVGIKKALVFYVGKAPKGTKTNWIMHEYRLLDSSRKSGSLKLDDWVLCRIYKKNPGGQKPILSHPIKEQSTNNSSPTSSSQTHLDYPLDTFLEMDDRLFSLPRADSLKTMQQDDKNNYYFNNVASGSFDWTSSSGFNSVPQLIPSGPTQAQTQGFLGYSSNAINTYMSQVPQTLHVESSVERVHSMQEEVQSGLRTQRVNNSGFLQQNPGVLTQNFTNSVDPYGFRYPTQMGSGFGFRM